MAKDNRGAARFASNVTGRGGHHEMDKDQRALWRARLEEAWPHLRQALWQRMEQGDLIGDLAGVVVEHQGEDEPFVTVGVLRREELAETLEEGGGALATRWAEWLRQPAPADCVPVFGALEGHSEVCVLGPVVSVQVN